jgi:hypothetical protein
MLVGNPRQNMPTGIAYSLKDYCELVDTTGRCIRDNNITLCLPERSDYCRSIDTCWLMGVPQVLCTPE